MASIFQLKLVEAHSCTEQKQESERAVNNNASGSTSVGSSSSSSSSVSVNLPDGLTLPAGLTQSELRVTSDEKDTALYYYLHKV